MSIIWYVTQYEVGAPNCAATVLEYGGSIQQQTTSVVGLFFEVQPKPGQRQAYFDQVEVLKPSLSTYDGLLWMQRYQSMDDPGLILSHQYWASEQALAAWRRNADHRHE